MKQFSGGLSKERAEREVGREALGSSGFLKCHRGRHGRAVCFLRFSISLIEETAK